VLNRGGGEKGQKEISKDNAQQGWVEIKPGKFRMELPLGVFGRKDAEHLHIIQITIPFYIKQTEVTQQEYLSLMGYNPSAMTRMGDEPLRSVLECGSKCPVVRLTWDEAVAFCNALSRKTGFEECYKCLGNHMLTACELKEKFKRPQSCKGFRLPTEAEWEYAARAGRRTDYSPKELREVAWYKGNSGGRLHPVAKKKPNRWNIYDMLGNVHEWCHDYSIRPETIPMKVEDTLIDPTGPSEGKEREIRGGSYEVEGRYITLSSGASSRPFHVYDGVGFRPVRSKGK
jgi:formylglycine-generating enzyme required for sulfatase activity